MDIQPIPAGAITPAVIGAYERVLGALTRPTFAGAVEDVLAQIVPSARVFMFECNGSRDAEIQLRVARYEPQIEPMLERYLSHYRAEDPFLDAVGMLREAEVVLMRVSPQDIRAADFREQFFHERNIVERLSLAQRTADGWRCMNISRSGHAGLCSDEELSHFVTLAQLLLPMMSTHWARTPVATPTRDSVLDIEQRFKERYPGLTQRELQVCARASIGMSVEGTALDLGIAVTSVLTYRRRAYARLSVSSVYELARLVLH